MILHVNAEIFQTKNKLHFSFSDIQLHKSAQHCQATQVSKYTTISIYNIAMSCTAHLLYQQYVLKEKSFIF